MTESSGELSDGSQVIYKGFGPIRVLGIDMGDKLASTKMAMMGG